MLRIIQLFFCYLKYLRIMSEYSFKVNQVFCHVESPVLNGLLYNCSILWISSVFFYLILETQHWHGVIKFNIILIKSDSNQNIHLPSWHSIVGVS